MCTAFGRKKPNLIFDTIEPRTTASRKKHTYETFRRIIYVIKMTTKNLRVRRVLVQYKYNKHFINFTRTVKIYYCILL